MALREDEAQLSFETGSPGCAGRRKPYLHQRFVCRRRLSSVKSFQGSKYLFGGSLLLEGVFWVAGQAKNGGIRGEGEDRYKTMGMTRCRWGELSSRRASSGDRVKSNSWKGLSFDGLPPCSPGNFRQFFLFVSTWG